MRTIGYLTWSKEIWSKCFIEHRFRRKGRINSLHYHIRSPRLRSSCVSISRRLVKLRYARTHSRQEPGSPRKFRHFSSSDLSRLPRRPKSIRRCICWSSSIRQPMPNGRKSSRVFDDHHAPTDIHHTHHHVEEAFRVQANSCFLYRNAGPRRPAAFERQLYPASRARGGNARTYYEVDVIFPEVSHE